MLLYLEIIEKYKTYEDNFNNLRHNHAIRNTYVLIKERPVEKTSNKDTWNKLPSPNFKRPTQLASFSNLLIDGFYIGIDLIIRVVANVCKEQESWLLNRNLKKTILIRQTDPTKKVIIGFFSIIVTNDFIYFSGL